jgi:hypothetical protein
MWYGGTAGLMKTWQTFSGALILISRSAGVPLDSVGPTVLPNPGFSVTAPFYRSSSYQGDFTRHLFAADNFTSAICHCLASLPLLRSHIDFPASLNIRTMCFIARPQDGVRLVYAFCMRIGCRARHCLPGKFQYEGSSSGCGHAGHACCCQQVA